MRRDRAWWWSAAIVWAVAPQAMTVLPMLAPVYSYEWDEATGMSIPSPMTVVIQLLGYLWVLVGAVAALVTGRTWSRRLAGAILVVAIPLIEWGAEPWLLRALQVVPIGSNLVGGTDMLWGLYVTFGLGSLKQAVLLGALVLAWFVATQGRARALWVIPIAFVVFWAANIGNFYLYASGLVWAWIAVPIVASLLICLIGWALARRRREPEPFEVPAFERDPR